MAKMITYGVCVVPQLKTKQNKKRDEGEVKNIALGGRKVCAWFMTLPVTSWGAMCVPAQSCCEDEMCIPGMFLVCSEDLW